MKFALKRDRGGRAFRFAPLQGETFLARVAAERRVGLVPHWIAVVLTFPAIVVSFAVVVLWFVLVASHITSGVSKPE